MTSYLIFSAYFGLMAVMVAVPDARRGRASWLQAVSYIGLTIVAWPYLISKGLEKAFMPLREELLDGQLDSTDVRGMLD